jgi:hypothetical protein
MINWANNKAANAVSLVSHTSPTAMHGQATYVEKAPLESDLNNVNNN